MTKDVAGNIYIGKIVEARAFDVTKQIYVFLHPVFLKLIITLSS